MTIIVNKDNVIEVANNMTVNSEMFGDEVCSVVGSLSELVNTANKFGCNIEGKVNNYYGVTFDVLAIPDRRRHSWSF